jgi:hypothetical protein
MDTGGSRPLLYPSPINGFRLPMRVRGERIGGRQKGTPNKISREFKEAVIDGLTELGAMRAAGKKWLPTGRGGLKEQVQLVAHNNHEAAAQLLVKLISPGRGSHEARLRKAGLTERDYQRWKGLDPPRGRGRPWESANTLPQLLEVLILNATAMAGNYFQAHWAGRRGRKPQDGLLRLLFDMALEEPLAFGQLLIKVAERQRNREEVEQVRRRRLGLEVEGEET